MTKWRYLLLIGVGAAFTFILPLKLCAVVSDGWGVALDIAAMLGSGIVCSASVSWFIDAQNEKRDKDTQERQREYILASVKNMFEDLYAKELTQFSDYYNKYISLRKVERTIVRLTVSEMGKKLAWLIDKIEYDEKDETEECTVITTETIRRSEERRLCLIKRNLGYYKLLHQKLLELSTHFSAYLISKVLTEEQIEGLKELTSDIHSVLLLSPDDSENDDTILTFKELLFKKTEEVVALLSITDEAKVRVHYRDVSS